MFGVGVLILTYASSKVVKTTFSPLEGKMPIYFGRSSIEVLPNVIKETSPDKIFILSDTTVYPLHKEGLLAQIDSSIPVFEWIMDPGENNKSLQSLEQICEFMFDKGASKSSLLINFGGGVILNLGGLAGSMLYRGISFLQVPTTLLAQSDVIVSNKQSVNFAGSKNRLGVFCTPKAAIVDSQWLSTEPVRQIRSALVEYCKNALILGGEHYEKALKVCSSNPSQQDLDNVIYDSLQQKFEIARKDPSERKFGLILEYGHTAGHAIEYLSNGKFYHGEAVWHGLHIAGDLGEAMGVFAPEDNLKQKRLLKLIHCIPPINDFVNPDNLFREIQKDNKKTGDDTKFVLLSRIGKVATHGSSVLTHVNSDVLKHILSQYLNAVL